jgi:hypothetical protein
MRTVYAYATPASDNSHEVVVDLDDRDEQRWEDHRHADHDPADGITWVRVTDQRSGQPVELRRHPCGLGCVCAAQARYVYAVIR